MEERQVLVIKVISDKPPPESLPLPEIKPSTITPHIDGL